MASRATAVSPSPCRDGHVWQQAESDIRRAKWNRPAASYSVTINYGSGAGLYDMRVNGEIYKVTRVK